MRMTVTKKLIINFFVLGLLPLLAIDTLFYSIAKEALIERTFQQLTFVRVEKTARIQAFYKQRLFDLNNIAENQAAAELLSGLIVNNTQIESRESERFIYQSMLIQYLRSAGCYSSAMFYTSGLQPYIIQIDTLHSIEYPSDWLEVAYEQIDNKEQVLIHEFTPSGVQSGMKVLLAKGLYCGNVKTGMIVLAVPIVYFSSIVYENNPMNGLGKTGESYLVGSDFLMRTNSRFMQNAGMQIPVKTIGVSLALADSTGTGIFNDYRGIRVLSSFGKVDIPILNWIIMAEIDANEAMIPIFVLRNSILYLSIIIALLLLGIVIFNATWIMLPLKKLKTATEVISQGKYGNTIHIKQQDEIGDLVEAFNLMSQTLLEQSERLEHEKIMRTTSMIDAQEAERQHLSRELHDGLGQLILAIRMKLEQFTQEHNEKNILLIAETRGLITVTVNEIRNISNNLMPSVLHEFGLLAALGKLSKEIAAIGGIQVGFNCNFQENELINSRVQIYVYRIVQEALNNIIKHATAKEVIINLNRINDNLVLNIQDDGKGFLIQKKSYYVGNGIANMKERTNLLGGQFHLMSSVGTGTRLFIEIPL